MSTITARQTIDMRGKKITTFILFDVVTKLRDMKEGQVIQVVTDAYDAIDSDIRAWTRMTGHKLVDVVDAGDHRKYLIEKAKPKEKDRSLAVVVSDAGLEELLSPLGFTLAAALEGIDVSIYFQGPAVKVLSKGFKEKLGGWARPFSRFARKGLAQVGHIPAQDKVRQLKELGARIYVCAPSMDHFGVEKGDLIFDDVVLAEYLTFMEVMEKSDIHFFLQ